LYAIQLGAGSSETSIILCQATHHHVQKGITFIADSSLAIVCTLIDPMTPYS